MTLKTVSDDELQPVCQGNLYDFDTGKCKYPYEMKGEPCIDHPNCMYKVGFPVLREKR